MARPVSLEISERNAQAVRMYKDHPELTYAEIGERAGGMKPASVYVVLSKAGVIDPANPKPRGKGSRPWVWNNALALLGAKLDATLRARDIGLTEGALTLGLGTGQRLRAICRGQVELTLSEASRIAKFLGYPSVGVMICEMEELIRQNLSRDIIN